MMLVRCSASLVFFRVGKVVLDFIAQGGVIFGSEWGFVVEGGLAEVVELEFLDGEG